MEYSDFVALVRRVAEDQGGAGLLPITELRRHAPELPREAYHRQLLRMRDESLVHLLTHVDHTQLSDAERVECIRDGEDVYVYWVRWLGGPSAEA